MLFWQKYWLCHKQFFAQRVLKLLLYSFYYGLALIIFGFILIKHSVPVAAQNPVAIVSSQNTTSQATVKSPNTQTRCKINAYVMRLNDFNFAQDSFFIDTWLYANCNKPNAFSFKSIYFPSAKDYKITYTSTAQIGEETYVIGNIQGNFEQSWNLKNYPFDRHKLQLFFEPSENLDLNHLIYESDMKSSKIHPSINLEDGWKITNFNLTSGSSHYISNFGDPRIKTDEFYFPKLMINFDIQRVSYMSFIKLTVGVYIAFAICFLCIFFDMSQSDLFTASLSILVGCLFAIFVNLQVAESILGEVEGVSLVDEIHIVTMLFILFVASLQTFFHRLYKGEKKKNLMRMERLALGVVLVAYIVINIIFIASASIAG